jgi:transposase
MTSNKAQYRLTHLLKDLKGKGAGNITANSFKYEPKPAKKRDWFSYNEAQVNETNDFLVLVKNMVDDARRNMSYILFRARLPGQQPKSPFDLTKAVLVQQYFQASNRVAAGLARIFKEKLGIEQDITYKDLERAYSNQDVQDILNEVLKMSNEPIRNRETKFSIDGTGLPASIKQNYANDREDDKKKAMYRLLIGMVGVEYKMFSSYTMNGAGSECRFLVPLLEETAGMFERVDLVVADAGYFSHDNCNKIAEYGAIPRIYPHIDAVINAHGSFAKKMMLMDLIGDAQKWLGEYHNRSISESVNSVMTCRFPRPLLKRRIDRMDNEGAYRVCAYNLRMLLYNHYTKNIDVKWLMPS